MRTWRPWLESDVCVVELALGVLVGDVGSGKT
jgi:hypothetical protein